MINNHIPVMINEVKSFLPINKNINLIDATFGGGGYSKAILDEFNIKNLIAIDRDPISKIFFKELRNKYQNIEFFNQKFSKIDESKRGFSFQKDGPLDMKMGLSSLTAYEIVNSFEESKLSKIFFELGEEKYSRRIAKNIIKKRTIKPIDNTKELSDIIKKSVPFTNSKNKIHPATKTFQALRIYVNDELNELKKALEKSESLLSPNGLLIIVSFQSLEDRIVKDFLNHKSGKRWRSSRHLPDLGDLGPITLKIITKKPLRPKDFEIVNNPRSRSAKLRVAQKI